VNILSVILKNIFRRPITVRFPEQTSPPKDFRGPIRIDTARCVGCGICEHVCVDEAINIVECGNFFEWRYDLGLCTFCERCAQFCPVSALTMQCAAAPAYKYRDKILQKHQITYPTCPECGQRAHRVSEEVLSRTFGETTEEILGWSRLCDKCRQWSSQRALMNNYRARSG
jgi:formate hydrogenlyase subunit 6/NADH:ubiquinone oxidoreductase subunit I